MTAKKKSLIAIIVFFMVLAIDFFFLHFIFPLKKQRLLKKANQRVESSLEQSPPVLSTVDSSPNTQKLEQLVDGLPSETDFKTAAMACLNKEWKSFDSFPSDLEKKYGVQSRTIDIENIHLKIPSGEERRLHIVSDGRRQRTIRYFTTDKTGVLKPLPIPHEIRSKPVDKIIEELKSQGQIFFHQTKERWLLGNGTTLIITFENKKPQEFQLFGPEKTLSCFKNSCQCL